MIKTIITTGVAGLALVFSINSFAADAPATTAKSQPAAKAQAAKNAKTEAANEAAVPFTQKLSEYQSVIPKALCASKKSIPGLAKLGVDTSSQENCVKQVSPIVYLCINELVKKNYIAPASDSDTSGKLIGGCVFGYLYTQFKQAHPNAAQAGK